MKRYTPATEQAAVELLQQQQQAGLKTAIVGHGSKAEWGGAAANVDAIIHSSGLQHELDHDQTDLVTAAATGMPWLAMQEQLATQGQWVTINPPFAKQATVGGVVATASAGAERLAYGSIRDQVIGARAILATGEVIVAGGRVIKNVAGFDLCKLLIGSFGGLALLTDITFKVAPLPAYTGFITGQSVHNEAVFTLGAAIRRTQLQPTAIQVFWPHPGAKPHLHVTAHGLKAVVERQLRELCTLLTPSLREIVITGPEPLNSVEAIQRDAGPAWPAPGMPICLLRIGVPTAALAAAFDLAQHQLAPLDAYPLRADPGNGLVWWQIHTEALLPSALTKPLSHLQSALQSLSGYVTIQSGPSDFRRLNQLAVDQYRLTMHIKRLFDPDGLLNPGRLGETNTF